jgi:hypothetical protein
MPAAKCVIAATVLLLGGLIGGAASADPLTDQWIHSSGGLCCFDSGDDSSRSVEASTWPNNFTDGDTIQSCSNIPGTWWCPNSYCGCTHGSCLQSLPPWAAKCVGQLDCPLSLQQSCDQGNSPAADSTQSQPPAGDAGARPSEDQAPQSDGGAPQPATNDDSAPQTNQADQQSQEDQSAAEREQEFEAQQAHGSASQNESGDNGSGASADNSIQTGSAQDQQPEVFKDEYASAIASAQADQPQPAEPSEPMDNVVQLASNSASSDGAAAEQIPDSPTWQETSAEVSADTSPSASTGSIYAAAQSFGKDVVANVQGQLPSSVLDYQAEGILPDPIEMIQTAVQETIQNRVQAVIPQSEDQADPVDAISVQIDSTFGRDLMVQLVKNGAGLSPLNNAKAVWSYLSNIVNLDIMRNGAAQVQAPISGSTDDQQ